jgi:hypothetical protein
MIILKAGSDGKAASRSRGGAARQTVRSAVAATDNSSSRKRELVQTVNADSLWTTAGSALLGVTANGLAMLGSFWIARDGFKQTTGLSTFLAAAVVFWTACTLGVEVLGSFGVLAVVPMVLWGLLLAVVGGVFRWIRSDGATYPSNDGSSERFSWDAVGCVALLLTAALVLGTRSLLLAVKVVSDGPIYHLYFAARWWKAGRLFLVASPFGESAATYFPANGDAWFAWLMATWGGDGLAKIGQVPFLILACLAAYGSARSLGAGRSASAVATCWFASSTPLLIFSFEPNVDTIFVAGYLIAGFFFLRASRGCGDTAAYCLGALAAGAALGTKSVGVVFVPPLLGLAIAAVFTQSVATNTKVARTLLVVMAVFLAGGFWFVRNAILTGNPLYPLEVRLMDRTVLSGWYGPEAMHTSPYYLPFDNWRALGDILLAVLDPRLAPLWVASPVAAYILSGPKRDGVRRAVAIFSIMAVVNVALYWVCIPYRTQQRFMLQALGLAVVPLAVNLDKLRWLRPAASVLLWAHLLTPQHWPFPADASGAPWDLTPEIPNVFGGPIPLFSRIEQVIGHHGSIESTRSLAILCAIVLVAVFMVASWSRLSAPALRQGRRWTTALLTLVLFLTLGYLDVRPEEMDPRVRFYPPFREFWAGWLNLEMRSGHAGSRVAYAGTNIPYYLLAIGLRNEVRYVNVDEHRHWLLHDYHRAALADGRGIWPNSRPGWDRIHPDFADWLDNLEAEGIQLLVVTYVNPLEGSHNVADRDKFPIERQWADSHPERFELIYGQRENDPWFRLYRIRQKTSAGSTRRQQPRPELARDQCSIYSPA